MDPFQTKIYTAIVIASGILGIVLIYFLITIVRNQRRHLKLEQANLLVEITTLEKERARIVSDLHDELGPLLSVVKFQVSSLETAHAGDIELIDKANQNLDTILERIRGICNELMPQVLTRKGIITAIREFAIDIDGRGGMKVEFTSRKDISIPQHGQIHLFRIIQEIVNNAVKHADATLLSIDIDQQNEKLIIVVKDNGRGFNPELVKKHSLGFGLKNILSRVNILKGDLYLASQPGMGTTYTIELPAT